MLIGYAPDIRAGVMVTRQEASGQIDSLLNVLDREIAGRARYEAIKRRRIDSLTERMSSSTNDRERIPLLDSLFTEYRSYNMDTALIIAEHQRAIALRNPSEPALLAHADLNRAESFKGLADYHRALEVLDSIDIAALDNNARRHYLSRYCSVYLSLYLQSYPGGDTDHYRSTVRALRDSLISSYPSSDWNHALNRAEILKLDGHPDLALDTYTRYIDTHDTRDIDQAVMTHLLAETLAQSGDTLRAKYYYTISAIMDIRSCTKKYMSLQELAMILNREGDTERAYRYINTTLSDITSSAAHSRLVQIAGIMPVITDSNTELLHRSRTHRTWIYILGILLCVILTVTVVMIRNRSRRIERHRVRLAEANHELREASLKLEAMNERQLELNHRLEESNRIKEAYIGDLFKLCSEYMEVMSKYRQSLRRMLKVGRTDEMAAVLARPVSVESMKEFLHKFDAIFLDIFPDFIDRFNELLEPEARIHPDKGELLTTELRIYALVRLGITDSTRIAAFLNYSTQTVYNYRQRIRDHAIVPKKHFAEYVAKL